MRGILVTLILVAPVLAGCVTTPGATTELAAEAGAPLVALDYPVRIVPVGFGSFDAEALLGKIEPNSPLIAGMRYFVTGSLEHEPLQFNVQYSVVEAPDAFAEALFAYAASIAEPGPPDPYLASYDRRGEQRVCEPGALSAAPTPPRPPLPVPLPVGVPGVADPTTPACDDIQRIDAKAMELWIAENRAAHGLAWDGPGEEIFVLDPYTKGWLPKDSYHQYAIDDGTGSMRLQTMRAWGGDHGFVFLDVGAAPSFYDHRPWMDWENEEFFTTPDGPIWDYADDMDQFYENLAWNVHDAVDMVFARDPIYPFEYAEKYVLRSYVVIDTLAHANPGSPLAQLKDLDYEELTDEAAIQASFAKLVPWAEVSFEVEYIYLPDDDPALAAALEDAKDRESTDFVDFGIIKRHIRENWESYVPETPGARTYPSFAFVLGAPSKGLFAYSDSDEYGDSFATFFNVADVFLCAGPYVRMPVCFTEERLGEEYLRGLWNFLFVHEVGHSFGLMHPHDTFAEPEGEATERMNFLWDSTATPMTYRHFLLDFAQMDVDAVHRGNAVNLARDILADENAGDAARAGALRAIERVRAGEYADALAEAAAAKRAHEGLSAAQMRPLPAGEPVSLRVDVLSGLEPVGAPAGLPTWMVPTWMVTLPVRGAFQLIPIEWPEGVEALQVEMREAEAPTHSRWAAYAIVVDHEDEYVSSLWNNGYDKVVLLDRARCADGCTLVVVALSGVNTAYDVTFTPAAPP